MIITTGAKSPVTGAPSSTLPDRMRGAWHTWVETAVRPRMLVFALLPEAGVGLVVAVLGINVLLGLLPVAFVIGTSVVVGQVPAAVAGGVGSADWDALVAVFVLASAAFLAQQVLAPLQTSLNLRMKRRIDGRSLDAVMTTAMSSAGIAPMEDPATLDDLASFDRPFREDWATPGEAFGGSLALVARYVRLIAFAVVVGLMLAWWAAIALVLATMLFRYGQRGGLRKYSQVWRAIMPVMRRAEYLRETSMGSAAAKESRIFGLADWLGDRYTAAYSGMYGKVAARRREVYLGPFLLLAGGGLALAGLILVATARAGTDGRITLTELALVLQSVVAALLLGDYYVESDVPTQYGMLAVDAKLRLERRIAGIEREERPVVASVSPDTPARELRLEGVRFAYPGSEHMVLDGLDLVLPAGRSTAVVGVNGAGKTTLVKLLTRLYEPTGGRVTADSMDIGQVDVAAWRRQVSVIFQDFIRYEFSAADNIALGAAHIPRDDRAVREAAERAGILEAFAHLPRGLDTPLSRAYPGGVDLSGGQWQRIAIARSLYALHAGARVLVLDEPTAALDVRAEAAFFDRFVELTRGVTSLLISHRFSSVRRADHIVVINGGVVVEQGTHHQLMDTDGHYARLFRLQAERFAAGLDAEGEIVETDDDSSTLGTPFEGDAQPQDAHPVEGARRTADSEVTQ